MFKLVSNRGPVSRNVGTCPQATQMNFRRGIQLQSTSFLQRTSNSNSKKSNLNLLFKTNFLQTSCKAGWNKGTQARFAQTGPPQSHQMDQATLDEITSITDHSPDKKKQRKVKIEEYLMHGNEWDDSFDPTGWFMGEKYDGIRVLWNGKELISRAGKPVKAPAFYTENLPKMFLDGELWIGRNRFEDLISVTRSKREDPWLDITYIVFDTPQVQDVFEKRLQTLQQLQVPKHVKIAEYIPCKGVPHMKSHLQSIIEGGGEGIVLRKPGSYYISGRCNDLLKVKPYQESEVKFVRIHPQSGGLYCEQPNGVDCIVKCPHQIYQHPPAPGTIITVQHEGTWKTGKVRYPYFWRERTDVNWDDLVKEAERKMEEAEAQAQLELLAAKN